MASSLGPVFRQIAAPRSGDYPAFEGDNGPARHDAYLNALQESPLAKLRTDLSDPKDLWRLSRVGPLLSDVVILSGMGGPDAHVHFRKIEEQPEIRVNTVAPALHTAWGSFNKATLIKWAKDAETLIDGGNLIYVPRRMLMHLDSIDPDGRNTWITQNVDPETPWALWRVLAESQRQNAQSLIFQKVPRSENLIALFNASLPYITDIPLNLLSAELSEHNDEVVLLRKALSSSLSALSVENATDPKRLGSIGQQIHADVISPEIARLNLALKKIMKVRAVRMAGASIVTLGLTAAAISTSGLAAVASSALGAGGIGTMAKEYAEYQAEISSLRENPWHFAWRLSRRRS